MANQDAAFGMKPVRMIGGAPYNGGQSRYRIAADYGTSIFQGDMVAAVTGGGVEVHADGGTVPIVGVFNGCMYTDPTSGEQIFSNYYPASTDAADIIAFVIDDPMVVFEIQAAIAFPIADLSIRLLDLPKLVFLELSFKSQMVALALLCQLKQ